MGALAAGSEGAPAGGQPGKSRSPEPPWPAVKRLLRGCQSAMLWPEDRLEFGAALGRAFDGCRDLLAVYPACTLLVEPRCLSVMGYPCPPDAPLDRFMVRLRERRIPAITFLEGTTKEEILELLRLLKAEPELIIEQGGGEAWLTASTVKHIVLQAPRAAGADDPPEWGSFLITQEPVDGIAFQQLLELCPEHCRGAIQGGRPEALVWLVEALGATAAARTDPLDREEWLEQAVAVVRRLKVNARGRLFRVYARPECDALGAIGALLTPEEAAEILVSYPKAVVGEPSEQLEAVLRRLMPDAERARLVEPMAKAMLLSRSMTEESYQNVVAVMLKRGPRLPAEAPGQEQGAGEVRRLSLLTDLLAGASAWQMQENRVDMLLELIATPGDWGGKQQLVQSFAEMIPASLAERDEARAVALLRRIEETIALGVLAPAERRMLRARLTESCSPELCRRLAHFVVREPARENAVVLWMIGQGEGGFESLHRIAQETPHAWLQQAAGSAIVQMGERSLEACLRKVRRGPPEEAAALARALVLSGTRDGLERALWAQEHRDARVVVALMEALADNWDVTAERVLLDALHDGSAEVQRAAARSLGRHPTDAVVAALSAFLNSRSARRVEVAESAVQALGQIGRVECVPALRAVLARKPTFWRGEPQAVLAQAAQGLAAIPHAAAEEALRAEANGKSPEISALCTRALEHRRSGRALEVGRAAVG